MKKTWKTSPKNLTSHGLKTRLPLLRLSKRGRSQPLIQIGGPSPHLQRPVLGQPLIRTGGLRRPVLLLSKPPLEDEQEAAPDSPSDFRLDFSDSLFEESDDMLLLHQHLKRDPLTMAPW